MEEILGIESYSLRNPVEISLHSLIDELVVIMSSFNQNWNQSMKNQAANGSNSVASKIVAMPTAVQRSKYLGVSRVVNKEAYIATAYTCGFMSRPPQSIYLGTFDREEEAARAYDLVSLKLGGLSTYLNFPIKDYTKAIEKMAQMSVEDLVSHIRRSSTIFTRGRSRFRGVFRNGETGKWQARITEAGKERILGTFRTEEEAAVAFDMTCIRARGYQAITNYNLRCYDVESILNANKMQQQAINANKMQQQAMEMQAINARQIWQQAMEMQAITSRKIQQKAMGMQAARCLAVQQQEPEDDPLRLTLGIGHTNPKKPVACHLSLGGNKTQNQEAEGLRKYLLASNLQTARKELASASNKNFNHGELSPFCSYQEMEVSKDGPKLIYSYGEQNESISKPVQGSGFQDVNSGVFKHYKNDPDMKGKAKVIYDD